MVKLHSFSTTDQSWTIYHLALPANEYNLLSLLPLYTIKEELANLTARPYLFTV